MRFRHWPMASKNSRRRNRPVAGRQGRLRKRTESSWWRARPRDSPACSRPAGENRRDAEPQEQDPRSAVGDQCPATRSLGPRDDQFAVRNRIRPRIPAQTKTSVDMQSAARSGGDVVPAGGCEETRRRLGLGNCDHGAGRAVECTRCGDDDDASGTRGSGPPDQHLAHHHHLFLRLTLRPIMPAPLVPTLATPRRNDSPH